jgi:hypothetical protein
MRGGWEIVRKGTPAKMEKELRSFPERYPSPLLGR